jgi:hypothetical protein
MKSINLRCLLAASFLLLCSTVTQAAITCNVTGRNLGELYEAGANNNAVKSNLTISCTRTASDPSTVFYTIKADFGQNPSGGVTRRVTGPSPQTPLLWILRHNSGGGNCPNTTNWGLTNSPGLLTGSLAFAGAALTANVTVGYCMEVRGTMGGNPAAPTPGLYIDTVILTPEMSTTAITGPYNVTAPITQLSFNVSVGPSCVVRKPGGDVILNYLSFGAAQLGSTEFEVLCSTALPYSANLSLPNGTIAGINYTVKLRGVQSPGGLKDRINNTGNPQNLIIDVNATLGQAGSCSTAVCTGTQVHTLTLGF